MDFNEFLQNTLENLVASLPQAIVILYTVLYYLKKVKKKTESFPEEVKLTKESLSNNFEVVKDQMYSSFETTKKELLHITTDFAEKLKKDVEQEMKLMVKELSDYKKSLVSTSDFTQILSLENKAFMDIILELVSKDPKMIKEGVSSIITERIKNANFDLTEYNSRMKGALVSFETALKQVLKEMGQEQFDELLERVGYEKLQTKK